jgi:hypothetical protein
MTIVTRLVKFWNGGGREIYHACMQIVHHSSCALKIRNMVVKKSEYMPYSSEGLEICASESNTHR